MDGRTASEDRADDEEEVEFFLHEGVCELVRSLEGDAMDRLALLLALRRAVDGELSKELEGTRH